MSYWPSFDAGVRFENGENHGEPRIVPADDRAARRAEGTRRDKSLDLDEQRPCSLHPGEHGGAGCRGVPRRQKQCGRVRDLGESAPGHFEDADLVGWAEAVFYRAEDAEVPPALALEGYDRIDHMFDDAGTGDLAVFCDMPNKDHCRAGCLRETDQRLRRAAHLADRARRRFDRARSTSSEWNR